MATCILIQLLILAQGFFYASATLSWGEHSRSRALADIIKISTLDTSKLSRSLQETAQDQESVIPPCNTVLGSLTSDELRAIAKDIVDLIAPDPDSFEYSFLQTILVDPIQYGIQVHRICAGCQDVSPTAEGAQVFDTFCGPANYGAVNATFSGLMFLPTIDGGDDGMILNGTLKGVIDMHPTSSASVPSIMWNMSSINGEGSIAVNADSQNNLLLLVDSIISSTGQVLIFPDYMGYAENAQELYKGYTIKKAYETSCVPIVLWAQKYTRELTNCTTELSSTVGVKGYSEGGYSSIVLADALHRMGWNIVHVHAGGGPYDMIVATTKTFERISNGLYDMRFRHILAMVGSSYSSTYADLPNYQQNQDMLKQEIRSTLVSLLTNSTPEPIIRNYMPYEDQRDILNLLFNDVFLEFVNASVSAGNFDPCAMASQEELDEKNLSLTCDAFQLNVVSELLQNAPYNVTVCHSPDDEVVPFGSVPDLSGNENVTFTLAEGSHNDAGGVCILNSLLYFLSPEFTSVTVNPLHSTSGCSSSGGDLPPTTVTTNDPMDNNTLDIKSGSHGLGSVSSLTLVIVFIAFLLVA
jgi:hypothetical protein